MSIPDVWSELDRMLAVQPASAGATRLTVVLDAACPPGLAVLGGVGINIKVAAVVSGNEPFAARPPFPVTVTPSALVSHGGAPLSGRRPAAGGGAA